VDPARDLGIAVSGEKLGAMVLAARGFLRGPSGAYFREMKGKEHPEMRDSVVALIFNHALLSEDTLWGELRKATRHLVRHLELNGFKVARSMAASDNGRNSAILIIPETTTLPGIEQRLGPTVDRERDLEAFISSGGGRAKLVWVDDDARVRLLRPRKHTSLVGLITDTAKGKEGPIGSPAELQRAMRRSGRVLTGPRLERAASSAGWLDCGIREIVSDAIGTSGS
jgi:tRNA nucleotidyltransferase (CCA-adding enzyme)